MVIAETARIIPGIEPKLRGLKPRTPLEQEAYELISNVVSSVLLCLPDRRRFSKLARTGGSLPIQVGEKEWEFKVEEDTGSEETSHFFVIMSRIDPISGELCSLGIRTDKRITRIDGVFKKVGELQWGIRIPGPISLIEAMKELRRNERGRTLRSFWQTHSVSRTSEILGIPQSRVKTHVKAYERRIMSHPKRTRVIDEPIIPETSVFPTHEKSPARA